VFRLHLFVLALTVVTPANAVEIDIGNGLRIRKPVQSMKDLRDRDLVRQAFDYSCGAAALATLLTYGLHDPVSEREILVSTFKRLSEDEEALRRKTGLSLLDMQYFVQERGHSAQGFRIAPAALSRLGGPVIVFFRPGGYEHFAVLRGIRAGRVFLADPSRGNVSLPVWAFLESWVDDSGQGIIFVAERADGVPVRWPLPDGTYPESGILTIRQLLDLGHTPFFQPTSRQ